MKKIELFLMLLCVAAMFGAIYIACYHNSYTKFAADTFIEGVDVSRMTLEESEDALNRKLAGYSLTITGADTTDVLSAEELGLHYINLGDELEMRLNAQKDFLWFLHGRQTVHAARTLSVTYDPLLLSGAIASLGCMNLKNPTETRNAYISYSNGDYRIVPEVIGNVLDPDIVTKKVIHALESRETELSLLHLYRQAEYTAQSEELAAQLKKIKKMLASDITVTNGSASIQIGKSDIRNFLVLGRDFSVKLDKKKIRSFVESRYGTAFDTAGGTWELTNAVGRKIQVSGGTYRLKLDTEGEAAQLAQDIRSGKTITRAPVCQGNQSSGENGGIGNTFIEVNLKKQTVYLVQDGEITLKTPVVTGNVGRGHATPTGVYAVALKARNYTMRKYRAFVRYWMPYDMSVGIGFHDASWRSSFGDDIYQTSGSHGCINMPYEAAKTLYESITPGIPVIVY